ncbi:hypothetical protein CQA49_04380 [Helicobacter sp. MIT 00-7814]|nr:hypothetical protein CQA37_04865 [Helicobacter sp. MIT 99-10781]RDU54869.1 hypothetical protein CQA49_04380 [Helicobacter sp. MIT 00-7814]
MSLTPLIVFFIIKNTDIYIDIFSFKLNNIYLSVIIICVAAAISYLYIYTIKKKCKPNDSMICCKVEIAEPKYIPIYITYFVIALSIPYDKHNVFYSWIIFALVFTCIYLLILKGKFSYFNPYLLFYGYHFYEIEIDSTNQEFAGYKIFLISKENIKDTHKYSTLIRLNNFVYFDYRKEN